MTQQTTSVSRRRFLAASAMVAASPLVLSSQVLGRQGNIAPNDKIVVGMVGYGGRGNEILGGPQGGFLSGDFKTVAICDSRKGQVDRGVERVNKQYNNTDCKGYNKYEDVLAREDIHAVVVATPDHWHTKVCIEACKAGKDVYCEKPLTHTVAESRQIVAAARKYDRVCSAGSQRVMEDYGYMAPIFQSGAIGKITEAFFECGGPPSDWVLPEQPVPEGTDWDRWLGPAPFSPYNEQRVRNWRGCADYGNGGLADWGVHKLGGIQYAIGIDSLEPVEILPPKCEQNPEDRLTFVFPGGIKVHHVRRDHDVTIVGTEDTFKHGQDRNRIKPLKQVDVRQYSGGARYLHQDFAYCIRNRQRPFQDFFYGAVTATCCILGCIAHRVNRALKWDAEKAEFIGDEIATRLVSRPKRPSYEING